MYIIRNVTISLCVLLFLTSCQQVRPWERGHLAKSEMAWDGDPLEAMLQDHIFFSKEASSGGNTTAGGGCGCN